MFFLITHLTFQKHRPKVFTKFIVGIVCYTLSFLILREIIEHDTYETYKYHIMSLLFIDVTYLCYASRHGLMGSLGMVSDPNQNCDETIHTNSPVKTDSTDSKVGPPVPVSTSNLGSPPSRHTSDSQPTSKPKPKSNPSSSPNRTIKTIDLPNILSISLSSEINDYKVKHDCSETRNKENDIFSNSDTNSVEHRERRSPISTCSSGNKEEFDIIISNKKISNKSDEIMSSERSLLGSVDKNFVLSEVSPSPGVSDLFIK